MPSIVTNFKFKSSAPNFERDHVKLISNLKEYGLGDYDRGHIVYCEEDNKHYVFGTNIDYKGAPLKNEKFGYFQEFKTGAFGDVIIGDASLYRTVFLFKSYRPTEENPIPGKPTGWSWDTYSDSVAAPADPQGWTLDDSALEPPIWLSIGTFDVSKPNTESWTSPVKITGEDGQPGTDGISMEFIYMLTRSEDEQPPLPENENVDDYVPRPWKDYTWADHPRGVSNEFQCEWMCQRFKTKDDEGNMSWGNWNENMGSESKPVLWSKYGVMGKDGDGVEYIYKVTPVNVAPQMNPPLTQEIINSKEYQQPEFIPEEWRIDGWTDNPTGTSPEQKYEWVSTRRFRQTTGKWEAFTNPALWAHYGQDGFKSFVFTRSNETPKTPVDGPDTSYENPIPVDSDGKVVWWDAVPEAEVDADGNSNSSALIWMSSKVFHNDSQDKGRAWSQPTKLADSADFDVEFNDSEEYPAIMPGEPGSTWYDEGDYGTNVSNAVWMATRTCKNGVWSGWVVVKIKGEKGDAGTSVQVLGTYGIFEELHEATENNTLKKNPPTVGDSYIVAVVNIDENGQWINPYDESGQLVNPTNTDADNVMNYVLFTWDGDSWVFLGKFQGDSAYIHIRYTANSLVLSKPGQVPQTDLYEKPISDSGVIAKYIGVCTSNKENGPNEAKDYMWSKFVGSDGFGYGYIYMRSKIAEAPNIPSESYEEGSEPEGYFDINYIPAKPGNWNDPNYQWWTDEPSGTNAEYPFEWMSWRSFSNEKWSKWKGAKDTNGVETGKAILHGVWSESGFTAFAFTRTNNDLSGWDMSNVTGTYNNPLPTMKDEDGMVDSNDEPGKTSFNDYTYYWKDSVPPAGDNKYEIVWMTSAKFTLDMDGINKHPVWSKPTPMSDSSDLDIDWCPMDVEDPGNPDTRPEIWWENPRDKANDGVTEWPQDGEPYWMATRKLKNGEPVDSWVMSKIKGEQGEQGPSGTSPSVYQLTSSSSVIKKNPNNNTILPGSIEIKLIKFYNDPETKEDKTEVLTSLPTGYTINVYKDGTLVPGFKLSDNISTANLSRDIEVELICNNKVIHNIFIPVVLDGEMGKDGSSPIMYSLTSDVMTIKIDSDKGSDTGGSYSASEMNLSILKFTADSAEEIKSLNGFKLYKSVDYGTYNEITSLNVTIGSPKKMLSFELKKDGTLIDRLMIPVVSDGTAGETTNVYSLLPSHKTITKDSNNTINPSSITCNIAKTTGNKIDVLEYSLSDYWLLCAVDYGSEKKFVTSDGTITNVSFSETSSSNYDKYKWTSKGSLSCLNLFNKNIKSVIFYIYSKSTGAIIDKEDIPLLKDGVKGDNGAPGESSSYMNLSNDMIAVQCEENGNVTGGSKSYTTQVELYYGTTKLTPSITVTPSPVSGISVKVNDSKITITVNSNAAATTELTVTASGSNVNGVTITLSKVLKIIKIIRGATGVGQKGEKGALMRNLGYWEDIEFPFSFKSGNSGELYIDYVFYPKSGNSKAYLCTNSHTVNSKSSAGHLRPDYSVSYPSECPWEEAAQFKFISTDLLNADQIVADVIQQNQNIVTDIVGDSAGGEFVGEDSGKPTKVVTKNGIIEFFYYNGSSSNPGVNDEGWVKSVDIGYDKNTNTGVLRFWDGTAGNGGNLLYNLGPGGILANSLMSPQLALNNYMNYDIIPNSIIDAEYNTETDIESILTYNDYTVYGTLNDVSEGNKSVSNGGEGISFKFETTDMKSNSNNTRSVYYDTPTNKYKLIDIDNLYKYQYMDENTLGNVFPQQTMLFDIYDPIKQSVIGNYSELPGNPTDGSPAYLSINQVNLIPTYFGTIGYAALHNNCKNLIYDNITFNFSGIGSRSKGTLAKPKRNYIRFQPKLSDLEEITAVYQSGTYYLSVGSMPVIKQTGGVPHKDNYFPPYFLGSNFNGDTSNTEGVTSDDISSTNYYNSDYNNYNKYVSNAELRFRLPFSPFTGKLMDNINPLIYDLITNSYFGGYENPKYRFYKSSSQSSMYLNNKSQAYNRFYYDNGVSSLDGYETYPGIFIEDYNSKPLDNDDWRVRMIHSVICEAVGFVGMMLRNLFGLNNKDSIYNSVLYNGSEGITLSGFSENMYHTLLQSGDGKVSQPELCRRNSICLGKEIFNIMNDSNIKFFNEYPNKVMKPIFVGYIFPEDMKWNRVVNGSETTLSISLCSNADDFASNPESLMYTPAFENRFIKDSRLGSVKYCYAAAEYPISIWNKDVLFVETKSSKAGTKDIEVDTNIANVFELYIVPSDRQQYDNIFQFHVKQANFVGGYLSDYDTTCNRCEMENIYVNYISRNKY